MSIFYLKHHKFCKFIFLFLFVFSFSLKSESTGLSLIYASKVYDKISLYDEEHLSNFSPLFITSIVYPELIRYSEKQDKVEKLINEISTHLFSEWEGFSIGLLQMKPEFAVSIEKEFNNYPDMKKLFPKINFSGETDSRQKKLNRLDRLCNSETQIEYLLAFTYIVKNKFFSPDINSNFIEKDVLFFFCKAYNYGINHTYNEIEQSKNFAINYSDIAIKFYDNQKQASGVFND